MKTFGAIQIRSLNQHDPPVIAAAFASIRSITTEAKHQQYPSSPMDVLIIRSVVDQENLVIGDERRRTEFDDL